MARPQKVGLDYFPIDVYMDMDDKIATIEALHGIEGFGILIKLLMKVYAEGYFYEWDEREQILFSKRINVDINRVNVVINDCIKWGLFNKALYDKYKVLTSKGIQARYLEACRRRQLIVFKKELLLLGENELKDSKNVVIESDNSVNVDINSVNDDIGTQRKEKKRKEYKYINYADNVKLTEEEHKALVDKHGEALVAKMIEKLDNYKGASGKTYKSDYKAILNWVVEEVTKNNKVVNIPAKKEVFF